MRRNNFNFRGAGFNVKRILCVAQEDCGECPGFVPQQPFLQGRGAVSGATIADCLAVRLAAACETDKT
ncbi:hypothetical protein ACIP1U_30325 [Cupriavidus sp. NPDC089707]|uniref:hypothetical protein n=1 Tax=Cupriavidus sp. NPDC089707 TaxID=3363963 RepID=UPI0038170D44